MATSGNRSVLQRSAISGTPRRPGREASGEEEQEIVEAVKARTSHRAFRRPSPEGAGYGTSGVGQPALHLRISVVTVSRTVVDHAREGEPLRERVELGRDVDLHQGELLGEPERAALRDRDLVRHRDLLAALEQAADPRAEHALDAKGDDRGAAFPVAVDLGDRGHGRGNRADGRGPGESREPQNRDGREPDNRADPFLHGPSGENLWLPDAMGRSAGLQHRPRSILERRYTPRDQHEPFVFRLVTMPIHGSSPPSTIDRLPPTRRLEWIMTVLGLYALLGGAVSFLGWPADIPRLTDWWNDGISIQPNTAVTAIAAGAAVILLARGYRRGAIVLGALIALIGASVLFEHATGIDLGIDGLLTFDRTWGQRGVLVPGRMGPPASTSWTLIGSSILAASVFRRGTKARSVALILAWVAASVAAFSLVGYLYDAELLYTLPRLTIIAAQTSSFVLGISLALIAGIDERAPTRWFIEDSAAGWLARRALPIVVLAPVAIGWVRLIGQERGLYGTAFGTALFVLVLVALLVALTCVSISTIGKYETNLRETEEALRAADRRKDDFLAILAHELRGPLAPLRNMVEIMKNPGAGPDVMERARSTMDRQLRQLVRLVDDLLDLSRITRDMIELRRERVELASIIRQSVEACRPLIDRARQQVIVTLPSRPIELDADPARLVQVISNILNNACKYSEPERRIAITAELRTWSKEGRMTEWASPRQARPRLEMFMVDRRLERSHGARSRTTSRRRSSRCTAAPSGVRRRSGPEQFVVRRRVRPGCPDRSGGRSRHRRAARRRFLIDDDNVDAASSLSMLLRIAGNETHVVHDGLEAVDAAGTERPDVVLLDIGLPGLNGYDACRRIREQPWGTSMVLVALTGWAQEEDRRKSREAGFDVHMVKPVDFETLMMFLATRAVEGAGST